MNSDEGCHFQQNDVEIGANKAPTVNHYLNEVTAYVNTMHTFIEVNNTIQHAAEHLTCTQVIMQKGLRMFGQPAVDAIMKEMKQFNDREVVRPINPSEITDDIKM